MKRHATNNYGSRSILMVNIKTNFFGYRRDDAWGIKHLSINSLVHRHTDTCSEPPNNGPSQKDCSSMTLAMKETRYASWVGMAVVPRLQHLTALLRLQSKFCAPSLFQ